MEYEPSGAERAEDPRRSALEAWLGRFEMLAGATLEPASGDASFRRYFRVRSGGESFIAMDSPPPTTCRSASG